MTEAAPHSSQNIGNLFLFQSHPDAWKAIAPHVRVKNFAKDAAILHHGDQAQALWLVLHGWVKLTRQTPDGKETIAGLCTEGDLFGEAGLFPHANYPYNADAIAADTEIAIIPADHIRALVREDAALSATIMAMLNDRVAQTQLKLEHMSTMSTAQRLGCFFLRLCNRHAGNDRILQIPIEKYLLASYLGMKPETLSRSQAQLKTVGVEVQGAQVNVNSISRLREFVCNSCSESGACESEPLE